MCLRQKERGGCYRDMNVDLLLPVDLDMVAILFALVITTNFIGSVDINGTIAMYRGARVRTRGGRGRGSMTNDTYNDYKRFDQNCFEVLSDLPDIVWVPRREPKK